MLTLTLAFGLLVAFVLCGYRVAFGPQKQLAKVGLGAGVCAVCFWVLALQLMQPAWLWAGHASVAVMGLTVTVLVMTSVAHWLRTPFENEDSRG